MKNSKMNLYIFAIGLLAIGYNMAQAMECSDATFQSVINTSPTDALFHAVQCNNLRRTQTALAAHADANSQNLRGLTPLYYATDGSIAQALIDAGADINVQCEDGGETALHLAIWRKNFPVIQVIINAGANLDSKDRLGNTALHHASFENSVLAIVQALIDAGAAKDILNNNDKTADQLTTNPTIARYILDHGVDSHQLK